MDEDRLTEYYFKIEGIMHNSRTALEVTQTASSIVEKIQAITGVDVTHTETAMILPSGDKMEYQVAGEEHA